MENEKQLNSAESIALIERMIAATRSKYEQGGGSVFLIWGYTSLAVSALVILLLYTVGSPWVAWAWWLIPIVGYTLMLTTIKKQAKPVKTHIDAFISTIWLTIGVGSLVFPIAAMIAGKYDLIIPIATLIISFGVIMTGLTIKFCPLVVGGLLAMLLSGTMLVVGNIIWLFMAVFIVTMIIPGHILNHRGKCLRN